MGMLYSLEPYGMLLYLLYFCRNRQCTLFHRIGRQIDKQSSGTLDVKPTSTHPSPPPPRMSSPPSGSFSHAIPYPGGHNLPGPPRSDGTGHPAIPSIVSPTGSNTYGAPGGAGVPIVPRVPARPLGSNLSVNAPAFVPTFGAPIPSPTTSSGMSSGVNASGPIPGPGPHGPGGYSSISSLPPNVQSPVPPHVMSPPSDPIRSTVEEYQTLAMDLHKAFARLCALGIFDGQLCPQIPSIDPQSVALALQRQGQQQQHLSPHPMGYMPPSHFPYGVSGGYPYGGNGGGIPTNAHAEGGEYGAGNIGGDVGGEGALNDEDFENQRYGDDMYGESKTEGTNEGENEEGDLDDATAEAFVNQALQPNEDHSDTWYPQSAQCPCCQGFINRCSRLHPLCKDAGVCGCSLGVTIKA